jgi:hypothetical protein
LASALLVFDANSNPDVAGISPERVDSLLGVPPHWRTPRHLMGTSLATLAVLAALIWQASSVAFVHATFNLPVLSSRPCLAILTMLPAAGGLGVLARRQTKNGKARAPRPIARRAA